MQVRLQSLPTLIWRISGRPRRNCSPAAASRSENRFVISNSSRHHNICCLLPWSRRNPDLGFFGMSQDGARTIERLRFGQGQIDNRIDEFEEFAIGRLLVKIVGLVANSIALAALHPMVVVVEHFFKWTAVNHGLLALETVALFSFEGFDRDGAKFNSLHSAPRFRVALQDLNSVEARILERSEKAFLSER